MLSVKIQKKSSIIGGFAPLSHPFDPALFPGLSFQYNSCIKKENHTSSLFLYFFIVFICRFTNNKYRIQYNHFANISSNILPILRIYS